MASSFFSKTETLNETSITCEVNHDPGRIGHFTVVCLVTWPLSGREAGSDLVFFCDPAFHM